MTDVPNPPAFPHQIGGRGMKNAPSQYNYKFRVEMRTGQDMRIVDADSYREEERWLIFYRKPPQGGTQEHWRVRIDFVASMETQRNG